MTPKEQKLAKSIGSAVSGKRLKKGLTQNQIAEQLSVEPETISRIERGVTLAPISRLSEIADVLGVPLADMLRDGSPRTSDRAQSIQASLQGISETDSTLLMEVFEKLATRLKKRL
jgi:transcriptional regulator with XRE-family HTH domain